MNSLFAKAMDSIPHQEASSADHPKKPNQPASSEVLSSAKLVAEAAQATFHNESDKVDKPRVAGAAGDLLDAAEHYGKLEGSSAGKYLDQAEDYLHKYHSSNSSTTTTTPGATAAPPAAKSGEHEGQSGGDNGGVLKMAQGFFNKN